MQLILCLFALYIRKRYHKKGPNYFIYFLKKCLINGKHVLTYKYKIV